MSSPIHKFLFSPPSSPPLRPSDQVDVMTNHGLTSLKTLLIQSDLMPRASLDTPGSAGSMKNRSPRTPVQRSFAMDQTTYPSAYSTPRSSGRAGGKSAIYTLTVDDMDMTPRPVEAATPPRSSGSAPRHSKSESVSVSQINVPSSAHVSLTYTLPRPLLRLLFLLFLLGTSAFVLMCFPAARPPSLGIWPFSLGSDDGESTLSSWAAGLDRSYVPPKVRSREMMKRSRISTVTKRGIYAAAPPESMRPMDTRPIPSTHELLALQSYLLESAYNVVPEDTDPAVPLDAHRVLGVGFSALGQPGSEREKAWFEELERERGGDVVVWYGGDGIKQLPHPILDVLAALHGTSRRPTLIPCHGRSDLPLLHRILERLSVPLKHSPLIMIGNTPIVGGVDALEDLRGSGKLAEMLERIGWLNQGDQAPMSPSVPKTVKAEEIKEKLEEAERAMDDEEDVLR